MKINKAIKFLSLPTAILAYLSVAIAPLASHPVEKWSRNYTCGEYDITVREEPYGVFSYQSRSTKGNLNLQGGTIKHTEKQKLFQFQNNNYEYWIWTNLEHGAGVLEVYQNKRRILKQDCLISGSTPIPLELQYPMSGIIVQGAVDRVYSLSLEKGHKIQIAVYNLGARANVYFADPNNQDLVTFRGSETVYYDRLNCFDYRVTQPGNYHIAVTGGPTNHFYDFLIAVNNQRNFCDEPDK